MLHPTQLLKAGTGDDIVQRIGRQLQDVSRLAPRLQEALPPEIRPHCRLVCVQEDRWLLCADSSEWAFRLRFAMDGIHRALRAQPSKFRRPLRIDVLIGAKE